MLELLRSEKEKRRKLANQRKKGKIINALSFVDQIHDVPDAFDYFISEAKNKGIYHKKNTSAFGYYEAIKDR